MEKKKIFEEIDREMRFRIQVENNVEKKKIFNKNYELLSQTRTEIAKTEAQIEELTYKKL